MVGVVTLSVELELSWGMHDLEKFSHLSSDRSAEERALRRLLDACDRLDIPVSFPVVGHLLKASCDGSHSGPYPSGWWQNDPGTSLDEDPLFYAPDLVDWIRDRDARHELCSHTYSHVLGADASAELLDLELQRSREAFAECGLPDPSSLVMPRHHDIPPPLLSEHGFRTIRRPIADYGVDGTRLGKQWWLLTRSHPACEFKSIDGIVETTCTPHPSLTSHLLPVGQRPPPRKARLLPQSLRRRIHRRYLLRSLNRAVESDTHVHLWTHLYNLSNDPQWQCIEPFLEALAGRRDAGDLEVRRMCDLDAPVAKSSLR